MQRFTQIFAALALLVTGGFWAKPAEAVDTKVVAKSGDTKPWPFGGSEGKCACAFCTGKAKIGAVADHNQL